MSLPNFLIVGASKSGTTSLYEYLGEHPDVFMSPLKETNFFTFDGRRPRFGGPDGAVFVRDSIYQRDDYERLFADRKSETAVGEASPRYLFTPGTAERIQRLIPRARIVAILRNPAERAFSAYCMRVRDGWESCRSLEEAMADEPRRLRESWASGIYLQRGYYGAQLSEYFDRFPTEQIRVYLYDDLRADPQGLLRDLFRFLGVDDGFSPDMSRRYNVSGVIRNPLLRFLWTRTHPLQAALRPFVSKVLRQRISRFFVATEKERFEMSAELRRRLTENYRADILQLQDLIQRDLSVWLRPG
ncbi:MAG: sulfotransferase [Acidobacteriota bacterium]|nr:sulfotransferase [Acidobacteriota bacterium]